MILTEQCENVSSSPLLPSDVGQLNSGVFSIAFAVERELELEIRERPERIAAVDAVHT